MPIATPEVYGEMIDRAKEQGFAYPAINVTSSQTLNAALQGFTEAGSDGIVQISTGGAEYASGQTVKDMVTGAVALAEYAHVVAKNYPINVALHTDHCQKEKLDKYVNPLIAISQERVDKGQDPLFNSHMWDGSAIEVEENLQIAEELLSRTAWVSRMPLKLVSLSIGRSWLIVGAAFFSASVRSCAVTFSGPSVSRPHGLTAMPPPLLTMPATVPGYLAP